MQFTTISSPNILGSFAETSDPVLKSFSNSEQIQNQLIDNFEKGLISEVDFLTALNTVDSIEKGGKKAMLGELRMFGGRQYIKTAEGWKFHGKGTGVKAKSHVEGSKSKEADLSPSAQKHKQAMDEGYSEEEADKIARGKMNKEVSGNKELLGEKKIPFKGTINVKYDKLGDSYSFTGKTRDGEDWSGNNVSEDRMKEILGISPASEDASKKEEKIKSEKKEKNNSGYSNTAKVPFGDKEPAIGMGGDRSKMIKWPEISSLSTSVGQKEADEALSQMSAQGRLQALERYGKALSDDRGRGKLHRKMSNHDSIAKFLDEARDKYIGDTKIKQDGIEIEIDKRGNTTINGKKVYVDKNSSYVKLGSLGRSSSTGGMYSSGHFDGQLQGTNYVHAFSEIVGRLKGGESIKDVVAGANRGTDNYKSDYKDTIKHLGLDSMISKKETSSDQPKSKKEILTSFKKELKAALKKDGGEEGDHTQEVLDKYMEMDGPHDSDELNHILDTELEKR